MLSRSTKVGLRLICDGIVPVGSVSSYDLVLFFSITKDGRWRRRAGARFVVVWVKVAFRL